MHAGEPCSSHDAICAVLTSIREGVREMRDEVKNVHSNCHDAICAVLTSIREGVREMRDEVRNAHSNSESATRTLERHIERQDALEAALAESLKDLRQEFGEYRQEHKTIVEELQRHAELLERVDTNARAVTDGGLTAALEKALPAVLGALGVREQARCNMWQAIVVGGIGAAAGVIGTWLSLGR